jgi:non-ribosomal peptide synthetase component F
MLPFAVLAEEIPEVASLQASFVEMVPMREIEIPDFSVQVFPVSKRRAAFDLVLGFLDGGEALLGMWEYSEELFEAETVEELSRQFLAIVDEVVRNPSARLSDLKAITSREPGAG